MFHEVGNVFRKYAVFSGRSSRREYWFFVLFQFCVSLAVSLSVTVISLIAFSGLRNTSVELLLSSYWAIIIGILYGIYQLGTLIPSLAVAVRRLHDTNRSGLFILMPLVPSILSVLISVLVIPSIGRGYSAVAAVSIITALLALASLVGAIVLIVFYAQRGTEGPNKYGEPTDYVVTASYPSAHTAAVQNYSSATMPVMREPQVQLKVICNSGALAGKSFTSSDTLRIGRSGGSCNVVFPDNTKGISRVHCSLSIDHGQAVLMDLGSTYGTYLENGVKLQPNVPVRINDNTRFYLADKGTWFTAYIEIR